MPTFSRYRGPARFTLQRLSHSLSVKDHHFHSNATILSCSCSSRKDFYQLVLQGEQTPSMRLYWPPGPYFPSFPLASSKPYSRIELHCARSAGFPACGFLAAFPPLRRAKVPLQRDGGQSPVSNTELESPVNPQTRQECRHYSTCLGFANSNFGIWIDSLPRPPIRVTLSKGKHLVSSPNSEYIVQVTLIPKNGQKCPKFMNFIF
jgi:hypothetical protein